jgi:hypothetical protein
LCHQKYQYGGHVGDVGTIVMPQNKSLCHDKSLRIHFSFVISVFSYFFLQVFGLNLTQSIIYPTHSILVSINPRQMLGYLKIQYKWLPHSLEFTEYDNSLILLGSEQPV